MMKSTKIKIAIALGLASAVALGLALVSSPVEADGPLKMYFEDTTFSGKSVQFLEGTSVKQTYTSFPSNRSYTRSSGKNYYLRIAGGADCKFVTDKYLNEKNIPGEVQEIYLTFANNTCSIDTKSFIPVEPPPVQEPPAGEEPPPPATSELELQVYTKDMSGLVMDLVFAEFDNTGKSITVSDNTVEISGNYWEKPKPITRTQSYAQGQGYTQMSSTGNGYLFNCTFDDKSKTQKVSLSKANVLIDLGKRTCIVSDPALKITDNYNLAYSTLHVTYVNGTSADEDYHYNNIRLNRAGEYSLVKDGRAERFSIAVQSGNYLDYCFIDGIESQANLELPTYASDITISDSNGICEATINK